MNFNVMTFNLRYWNERDGENAWPNRKDQVAQVILKYDPLVIGIQEGLYPMLQDLDQRLPQYARVGEGREGVTAGEFSAIYYRKDLLEVKHVDQMWLSETPDMVGSKSWDSSLCRICTWALFEVKETKNQFMMFNTHMDHIGEVARLNGARLIWARMKEHVEKGLPCLLTGDLNCRPEAEPIQYLRSHLVDAAACYGKDLIGTAHNFTGETDEGPIDYIFHTPNITVNDVRIIKDHENGRYPSDHFPVWANVDL